VALEVVVTIKRTGEREVLVVVQQCLRHEWGDSLQHLRLLLAQGALAPPQVTGVKLSLQLLLLALLLMAALAATHSQVEMAASVF
tara:strand:- start:260 stop:514 length:255 start_codon:yes stop_codon:yes gene_type:complete